MPVLRPQALDDDAVEGARERFGIDARERLALQRLAQMGSEGVGDRLQAIGHALDGGLGHDRPVDRRETGPRHFLQVEVAELVGESVHDRAVGGIAVQRAREQHVLRVEGGRDGEAVAAAAADDLHGAVGRDDAAEVPVDQDVVVAGARARHVDGDLREVRERHAVGRQVRLGLPVGEQEHIEQPGLQGVAAKHDLVVAAGALDGQLGGRAQRLARQVQRPCAAPEGALQQQVVGAADARARS